MTLKDLLRGEQWHPSPRILCARRGDAGGDRALQRAGHRALRHGGSGVC
jgi:hypothetical protein